MEISGIRQLTKPRIKKIGGRFFLFSEETDNVPCGVYSSLEELAGSLYGKQFELFNLEDILKVNEEFSFERNGRS